MLAYMKYENGLRFQKIVFENENAAKLWLKQNGINNPNSYELLEVEFFKEDAKELKKIELEEKLAEAKIDVEWAQRMYNLYGEDMRQKYILKYEKIQKEIDNL